MDHVSRACEGTAPVVLVTGYGPFSNQRVSVDVNASWEAVRPLEGMELAGHRVLARQMEVRFNEPFKRLSEWRAAFEPVLIGSFGVSSRTTFDLETLAHRERGEYTDISGLSYKGQAILPDGPELLTATFPVVSLRDALCKQGYPVELSQNAGRYLCEETLYVLEALRARNGGSPDVFFCHVPGLGVSVQHESRELTVDAEYLQRFAKALVMEALRLREA